MTTDDREMIDCLKTSGAKNIGDCLKQSNLCLLYLLGHPASTPETYDAWRVSRGMLSSLRTIKRVGLKRVTELLVTDINLLNQAMDELRNA